MSNGNQQPKHLPVALGALTYNMHRPMDLIIAATSRFRARTDDMEDDADELRDMAVTLYGKVQKDFGKMPSDETTEYMHEFIKKIGDFFFLSALDNVQYTWDGPALGGNSAGVTSGIGANTSVTLEWLARKKKGPKALKQLLGTILHESIHVMFHKYSCMNRYCGSKRCQDDFDLDLGAEGHGGVFVEMVAAIEKETEWYFDGVQLDVY